MDDHRGLGQYSGPVTTFLCESISDASLYFELVIEKSNDKDKL